MAEEEAEGTGTDRNGKLLTQGAPVRIRGTRGGAWSFRRHVRTSTSEWIEVWGASGLRPPAIRSFPVDRVELDDHPIRDPRG